VKCEDTEQAACESQKEDERLAKEAEEKVKLYLFSLTLV